MSKSSGGVGRPPEGAPRREVAGPPGNACGSGGVSGSPGLDPDGLRAVLEAAGRRYTPHRLAVYQTLGRAGSHPRTDDIYRAVRAILPRISLATVYKALDVLVACGLANRLTADDGSARYDARSDRHYHVRCLRSGLVSDLDTPYDPDLIDKLDPELTPALQRQGFQVTGYRLELVGYFAAPTPERGPTGPVEA